MLISRHGLVEGFGIFSLVFPGQSAVKVKGLGLQFHRQLEDSLSAQKLIAEIGEHLFDIDAAFNYRLFRVKIELTEFLA